MQQSSYLYCPVLNHLNVASFVVIQSRKGKKYWYWSVCFDEQDDFMICLNHIITLKVYQVVTHFYIKLKNAT